MIRVVVFDFDGTLVDSNRIKEQCLYATVSHLEGGAGVMSEVRKLGGDRFALFDAFAIQYFAGEDPVAVAAKSRALAQRYGECCYRGIAAAPERRGARHALTTLARRGLKLWILSATPIANLRELLHRRGLNSWLRGALGSPMSKIDGLKWIMQAEQVRRSEIIMVGDGFDDEAAARAVKIRFAGITLERSLSVRGRFNVSDLRRLPPLLEEFGGRARTRS